MCASANQRLALPVAVYPGMALARVRIQDVVTDAGAQCAASLAIHRRYRTPALLSAMDLSVEAEAFGCRIHMAPDEIPTTVGSLVTSLAQAETLAAPAPGAGRTQVYLDTVRQLRAAVSRRHCGEKLVERAATLCTAIRACLGVKCRSYASRRNTSYVDTSRAGTTLAGLSLNAHRRPPPQYMFTSTRNFFAASTWPSWTTSNVQSPSAIS